MRIAHVLSPTLVCLILGMSSLTDAPPAPASMPANYISVTALIETGASRPISTAIRPSNCAPQTATVTIPTTDSTTMDSSACCQRHRRQAASGCCA